MDEIERSGKTVDDAVNDALKILGAVIDEVEVTVLEPGAKGIFGFGSKLAKVSVRRKFDPARTATNFLREVMVAMGLSIEIEIQQKEKQLLINLKGQEIGILIGKRGQTLDSLQYLVNLVVNKGNAPYIGVTLDTENYRQRRKETLESLAYNLAKKVKITRKSVVLEPMSPYERRIIHAALQSDRAIVTHSEGEEPFRNIVIGLK